MAFSPYHYSTSGLPSRTKTDLHSWLPRLLKQPSSLFNSNNNEADEGDNGDANRRPRDTFAAAGILGVVAQPVLWVSLYSVATTGVGLAGGSFGLLGALEGISYLVAVAYVGYSLYRKGSTGTVDAAREQNPLLWFAENLSYVSVVAGIIVLGNLVLDQGCVPNANPSWTIPTICPCARLNLDSLEVR